MRFALAATALAIAILPTGILQAREVAKIERMDAATVELTRDTRDPVAIWLSRDTAVDEGDTLVAAQSKAAAVRLPVPADQRMHVLLLGADGKTTVVSERRLPLEQGSNFRDIGGYVTKDGRTVRWGKAYRSGAMPKLTKADFALIEQLDLDAVVDFRSMEERMIGPDLVDDRTGAMFIANDYSMKVLFERLRAGEGENVYQGMEQLLVPQFRALYQRLMADEGAVLYHCSAGQDRTGIATALLYDMLGVDRETILKDYHLSTEWRRPQWEMPEFDPVDHPNNPIIQYYASRGAEERKRPEPLYSRSGKSHLAQFFTYLDSEYGGSEGYMVQALGFSPEEIARLRQVMLD